MQRFRQRRTIIIGAVIGVALLLAGFALYTRQQSANEVRQIPITQLISLVERREISRASINGPIVNATDIRGTKLRAVREDNYPMTELLRRNGVELTIDNGAGEVSPHVMIAILPIVLILGLLFVSMRRSGVNNPAMSFGRSGARMANSGQVPITFADVAGVEEAKQELTEIVSFLKHPERFAALGARIPKGVLLVGPPGTGKTLIARAVAGEAGVPFFSISGSEFVEMFVGVGASRVRDLFRQAKKQAPCIIFVDEIDAVGRQRGSGPGGGNDEREQTLNQLLVEMDGFDTRTNIIIIAATNRPDILDAALLRPGRFDRRVTIDTPDIAGRRAILEVHSRAKPLSATVRLDRIAQQTVGFSGADLMNLMNEAAILAGRIGRTSIETQDIEEAMMRVVAGPERRHRIISPYEKSVIAYHEVGHALAMRLQKHAMPVRKVSVISRGQALGVTVTAPAHDTYLMSRQQLTARMISTLGGRVAEELIFGDVTTGARQDIEQVTNIARRMVTEFGMSNLGVINWAKDGGAGGFISDELSAKIDLATNTLIEEAYSQARVLLTEHRDKLVSVSEHLMHVETLDGDELDQLLGIQVAEEVPLEPVII